MANKKVTQNKVKAEKQQKKSRITRIVIGVVLILAAAALVIGSIFLYRKEQSDQNSTPDATSYEKVLGNYYRAILTADGKTMSQIMAPPEYWTYYMKTYNKDEDDIIQTFADGCTTTLKEWQDTYGLDVKVSYQITGMSQQGEEGLAEWNSDMESMLGSTGANISEAVMLEVKLSYTGNLKNGSEVMHPTIGKIGDSWYIIEEDSDELKSGNGNN